MSLVRKASIVAGFPSGTGTRAIARYNAAQRHGLAADSILQPLVASHQTRPAALQSHETPVTALLMVRRRHIQTTYLREAQQIRTD